MNFFEIKRLGHKSAVFWSINMNSLELYLFPIPIGELTWIIPISQKLDSRTWNLLEIFWFKRNNLNYTFFTGTRHKNVIFTGIILIQAKLMEFDTEKQFFGYFTKFHQQSALWCPNTIFTRIILISKKFNELDTKAQFFGEFLWNCFSVSNSNNFAWIKIIPVNITVLSRVSVK